MSTFRRHDAIKTTSLILEQKVIAVGLSAKKSQPSIREPLKKRPPLQSEGPPQSLPFYANCLVICPNHKYHESSKYQENLHENGKDLQ